MDNSRLNRLIGFLSHDPLNRSLLLDTLALAIESGEADAGQQLIEHISRYAIEDPTVCAQAAHLLLQRGAYEEAALYGRKAIDGGIEDPAVLFNAAFGCFYSGDYVGASQLLARLSPRTDCPAPATILHARALHHQGHLAEAQQLVLRALELEPGNPEARGLMALLQYDHGEAQAALRTAHEALAEDPNQLDALIACAGSHFEQGNLKASRKTWLHAVSAHPNCGRAWSGFAQLEFSEMELDQAEEHLKAAVQFMPNHIGTWHLLAWIYILRKDSTLAREALDKAYALDRNFGETHGGLAIVDVIDGFDDRAELGIRRALKLNPAGLAVRYAELLLLEKAGKAKEAEQLVNQVLDRTAPSGNESGRAVLERWLTRHKKADSSVTPGHH